MTRQLSFFLAASLLMAACAANPAVTPPTQSTPDPNLASLKSDIRPGSKGQRLELTELEGEMVIPAGTSAYTIQSTQAASAPKAQQVAWLNLLMPAAHAQEAQSATPTSTADAALGDAPLESNQLKKLTAKVNQKAVTVQILSTQDQSDGSVIISYRLRDVPVTDENAIIEFASPSGRLKIKGVLPKIAKDMKLSERFSVETTALAEALENSSDPEKSLTEEQLRQLAKDETVQKLRDKIYEMFVQPPQNQRYDDVVKSIARTLIQNSPLERYLNALRQCQQRGPACAKPPLPPPQVERQLLQENPALMEEIRVRVGIRLQPLGTRRPTLAERDKLLLMPLNQRRLACRDLRVYPCPGLPLQR